MIVHKRLYTGRKRCEAEMRGKNASDFAESWPVAKMRGKNASEMAGGRPQAKMRGKNASECG
ncbi:hypothetical protein AWJ19_23555 [Paenibacillus sp. DMB5]|nr:hypothetical protein AWJ19_23555 [Paenibacillus sp. DMB5]